MFIIWKVYPFDQIDMALSSVAASLNAPQVTGRHLPLQAPTQFSEPPGHRQRADLLLELITRRLGKWRHLIRENANRPGQSGG